MLGAIEAVKMKIYDLNFVAKVMMQVT